MSRAAALLLAPIVLVQASLLRRRPRLAEPMGARAGGDWAAAKRRVLVLGDSTAVGTGVDTQAEALVGALVGAAHDSTSAVAAPSSAAWQVIGRNGATTADALAWLTDLPADPHLAVVVLGWNDALHLRSARAYARDLAEVVDALRAAGSDTRLVVVAPPVFARFPVLPQPLRWALGRQAVGLTRAAREVARSRGAALAPGFDGASTASDGFHPDAAGYAGLADGIRAALAR